MFDKCAIDVKGQACVSSFSKIVPKTHSHEQSLSVSCRKHITAKEYHRVPRTD